MILEWVIIFVSIVWSVRFGQYLAMTNMKLAHLCLIILAIKFLTLTYAN